MGFYVTENGLHSYVTESGLLPLVTEDSGRGPSTVSLATFVGYVPANFNMGPWTATATHTDFNWVDGTVNQHAVGFLQDGISVGALTTAPDGTTTGQHLTESVGTGSGFGHRIYTFLGAQMRSNSNITFRCAAIVKADTRTRIVLEAGVSASIIASLGYDLAGGNVGYDIVTGADATVVAYSMTALPNGWWLCHFDMKYTGSFTASSWDWQPKIYLDAGSGTAARDILYTGNGTSGVYAWWLNVLPVAAWSLTNVAFNNQFTSLGNFDLANTVNPGFDFYLNNVAPNSLNQTWWGVGNLASSLASNFSISSPGVLQIYDPNNNANQWTSMCYTVGFPVSGGYVGNAWQAPMMFDGMFQWDSSLNYADFGFLGPAAWGHQVEAMAGTMNPSKHWMEWDWIDIGATTLGVFDHALDASNVPAPGGGGVGQLVSVSMSPSDWHRISGLWLNMASDPSGQGLIVSFFDGVMLNFCDVVYNANDLPQPPLSGTLAGFNSQADWMHMPIMMDTGNNVSAGAYGGWPMRAQYVQVITNPSPPKIYNYWNIFDQLGDVIVGNNGLQLTKTTAGTVWEAIRASFGKSSGKWYWEITLTGTVNSATSLMLGIMSEAASVASNAFPGSSAQGAGARHGSNWNSFVSGVTGGYAGAVAFANADVFGFAFDAGAGVIWVHRNGSWINGTPGSGSNIWSGLTGHTWYPASAIHDASVSTISANFGSSAFVFSLPSGYLGLAAN